MTPWNPEDDHYSFAISDADSGQSTAALAWRGESIIAIELHEIIEMGDEYVHTVARSVRVYRVPGGYPQQVPIGALKAVMKAWEDHESDLFTTDDAGNWALDEYAPTDMRQPPFAEMRRRFFSEYSSASRGEPFTAPSAEEVALVQADPKWLQEKGWTRRTSEARLRELQAVGHYVSALSVTAFPLPVVAKAMGGITDAAVRNLLGGAKDHGYLEKRTRGVASGWPSELARRLSEEVRQHARRIEQQAAVKGSKK